MRHPMRFRSSVGFPTQRNEYSLRAHQEYRSGGTLRMIPGAVGHNYSENHQWLPVLGEAACLISQVATGAKRHIERERSRCSGTLAFTSGQTATSPSAQMRGWKKPTQLTQ